jgi:hypothetical protein
MNEQAVVSHATRAVQGIDAEVKHEADPGPWLFLAAPVSFALTLVTICWFSLHSF